MKFIHEIVYYDKFLTWFVVACWLDFTLAFCTLHFLIPDMCYVTNINIVG